MEKKIIFIERKWLGEIINTRAARVRLRSQLGKQMVY